ncbi:MAG: hypothetical protein V7L04_01355 [Nostoc sp.]|uniref:hypothetical protein n=1 Tax=Nostoc sp. TaxID=1180 RepID=UPI002FF9A434
MFKDYKTGGYNLESTYADGQRLIALILSNRIQESGVRIQLGILYDWWMNNRRFCTPTKQENLVVNFRSRGSESPTDSVTLSRVRVRF